MSDLSVPEKKVVPPTLLAAATDAGLAWTGESREVYKIWVDFDSPDNITELQMGI